jgi:hypothetical protein
MTTPFFFAGRRPWRAAAEIYGAADDRSSGALWGAALRRFRLIMKSGITIVLRHEKIAMGKKREQENGLQKAWDDLGGMNNQTVTNEASARPAGANIG